LPRQHPAALGARPGRGRGRGAAAVVALGRERRRGDRHDDVRRLGPREGPLQALRVHARPRRPGRAGRRPARREGVSMSSVAQVTERLAARAAAGTSVWLAQLRRSLVSTGELERLIAEDSLRGVTSNPAIFAQAMLGSPDYDDQIEELANLGKSGREVYRAL